MDMFLFILGILCFVTFVISLFIKPSWISALVLVVGLVFTGVSATTIIAPRTVGVVVEFGKPTSALDNGLHWKAPWASVEKLDGAVQNDVYGANNPLTVRLGNNSQATADASIQWQLKSDNAMEIFLDYRTFENIQQNLVDRNFKASMNEVMATYNPLDPNNLASGGSDLKALSDEVLENMRERVGDLIDVKTVTIPIINFNESTQSRIDELQSEVARTRIAEQRQETAKAEAEANRQLESSLSNEVLVSKCLDIISESGQAPIGCFPGSDVTNVNSLN